MTKHSIAASCTLALAAFGFAPTSFAADGKAVKETKQLTEVVKESWISGDIGIDVYSQYIFHGLTLENQGAIIQPYADWYFKLYEGDGFLNKATLNLSIWNSFHSNHPVASTTRSWYEFDFYAGVSFTFAKNFTFTPTYIYYGSPGDYFANSQNLGVRLAYDDKDLLGAFSLQPYAYVEFELDGKSGNGTDQGVYYEVGIAPSTSWGNLTAYLPIKAGFGSNDYYASDAGFGFFSAGVLLSYAMAFVPEHFGAWSLTAGATFYQFGDANDDANAIKNGDDNTVVFNGGLRVAF